MVQDEGVLGKSWYEDLDFLKDSDVEDPGEFVDYENAFPHVYFSSDPETVLSVFVVMLIPDAMPVHIKKYKKKKKIDAL
jgi:hypothetical protein